MTRETGSECAFETTVAVNVTSMVLPMLNVLPNASSTTFVAVVEAVDTGGRTSQSEVSLLLDASPPEIGLVEAEAFSSGKGTDGDGVQLNATVVVTDDTVVRLEVLGGAEDTDVNELVSIHWEAFAMNNREKQDEQQQLPPPECKYLQLKEDGEWVWAAHCRMTESVRICFRARAVSAIGLVSSPTPSACIVMRLHAPTWPSIPALTTTTLDQLNVSWPQPIDTLGALSTILYQVCTHAGCADSVAALPRQQSALMDLDTPFISGYEGEVWVVLHASPSYDGKWIGSVESGRVIIGGDGPTRGHYACCRGKCLNSVRR